MISQADDFKAECDALYALLHPLSDIDFEQTTQFKGWSLNDVLEHLHIWNWAARESLVNEAGFDAYIEKMLGKELAHLPLKERERQFLNGAICISRQPMPFGIKTPSAV
jgi:hypothetical protein